MRGILSHYQPTAEVVANQADLGKAGVRSGQDLVRCIMDRRWTLHRLLLDGFKIFQGVA